MRLTLLILLTCFALSATAQGSDGDSDDSAPAAETSSKAEAVDQASDDELTCDDIFDIELYANSKPRQINKASRCVAQSKLSGTERECVEGRLKDLESGNDQLNICDCAAGPLRAPCAKRVSDGEKRLQDEAFDSLRKKLNDGQKKALDALRDASDEYVSAQGDLISYLPPGSPPPGPKAPLDINTRALLRRRFFSLLQDFEANPEGLRAKVHLNEADRHLNSAYGKCLRSPRGKALPSKSDETVTYFRDSERQWIALRDAWTVYCRTRRSATDCTKLSSALTSARAQELEHGCGMILKTN